MTVARWWLMTVAVYAMAATVSAQDDPAGHQHHPASAEAPADKPEAPSSTWTWATDANVFAGYNYQERHFADFSAWESQNWFMGSGSRPIRTGRLTIASMVSLEPFTLNAHGSPQLFQTGESYQRAPLLNYQHPHDLVMELGATYARPAGRLQSYIGADLVGSPTLGPVPFMHRESARSNPQVPLTHHFMDSTHITTGVVRGGVSVGPVTFESSVFRGRGAGRKPAQHRTTAARFVGRSRAVQRRSVARAVLRRSSPPTGMVRSLRCDAPDGFPRVRW